MSIGPMPIHFDTHGYLGLRVHWSWAFLEQSSDESNGRPVRGSPIIVDRRVMPTSARETLQPTTSRGILEFLSPEREEGHTREPCLAPYGESDLTMHFHIS